MRYEQIPYKVYQHLAQCVNNTVKDPFEKTRPQIAKSLLMMLKLNA
jgi:hypothetical protein